MPGKVTQLVAWRDVRAFLDPAAATDDSGPGFTVTPMRTGMVIRLGEDGEPELVRMRWGVSAPNTGRFALKHMHARSETVDSSQRFSEAFAERRGILMVETFNEGQELAGGAKKQFVVRPRDGKPLALAVIWEEWQGDDGAVLTFNMLTVPANPTISPIEERMPAVLHRDHWPRWLGQDEAELDEVKALLCTHDDCGMWEVTEQAPPKSAKTSKEPKTTPPPKPTQGELF